jgi:hypothetical protein
MADGVPAAKPRFGIGTIVSHPMFGNGRVFEYDADGYVILFKGNETKRVAFNFEALKAESAAVGDPELDRIKRAVREVLGDYGWLDVDLELGKRWVGGTMRLIPGKDETKPYDVSIEMFFKKVIGVRDKLRVLEQKINAHPVLSPEEKAELQGYITRSYGSLTTFNCLFANKESNFKGTGDKE